MSDRRLYRIGELARLSGVPVKTIRHYSDIGVLPPARRSAAGYRLYGDRERVRLEIVRTLRAAGFDLATIRGLLEGEGSVADAVQLQLEAVELQLRALQRQRAVLRQARQSGDVSLEALARLQALARLDAVERESFVASRVEGAISGIGVDPAWKSWLWRAAFSDMPDELDDARLQAWLELAVLVSDEDFLRSLERQARWFWESTVEGFDAGAWQPRLMQLMARVRDAARAGEPPRRRPDLVDRYLALNAEALGGDADAVLAARLVEQAEATYDPRGERFWDLVMVLQGREPDRSVAEAFWWLIDGLRDRIGPATAEEQPDGGVGSGGGSASDSV